MAQNRIIPYGYKIENGKLTIEPEEKHIVVRIYERYANGESYLQIAERLTALGVRYTPEKAQWNKNMVARVLQNKNYLGNNKYPTIIHSELLQSTEKQAKPYTHRMDKDMKALKPYLVCNECGEKLRRRLKATGVERWYCPNDTDHISLKVSDESLAKDIMELQRKLLLSEKCKKTSQAESKTLNLELIKLKNRIDLAMNEPTPNLEEIKESIMKLAREKYSILENIGEDSYLSHTIERLSNTELDSKLLPTITMKIVVSRTKAMEIVLTNGQKIKN
jgi:hypothetical protein